MSLSSSYLPKYLASSRYFNKRVARCSEWVGWWLKLHVGGVVVGVDCPAEVDVGAWGLDGGCSGCGCGAWIGC